MSHSIIALACLEHAGPGNPAENLEHHISDEEDEMFPKVEQVFEDDELQELGTRMQACKEELQAA